MDRYEVMVILRQNHAEFEKLLSHFSPAQMDSVAIRGHWTIRDVVVHLAEWEWREVDWINALMSGRSPVIFAKGFEWDGTDRRRGDELINTLNAATLERSRRMTVSDALAEFDASQAGLLDLVTRLPEASFIEPDYFFWVRWEVPREPWAPLPLNSHEHYHYHARWLRDWIDKEAETPVG